jgi:hypothetical protein
MNRTSRWLISMTLASMPAAASAICGDGIIDGGEDCDDGGYCIGGADAGTACTAIDENGDGRSTVDELVRSITIALIGCGHELVTR